MQQQAPDQSTKLPPDQGPPEILPHGQVAMVVPDLEGNKNIAFLGIYPTSSKTTKEILLRYSERPMLNDNEELTDDSYQIDIVDGVQTLFWLPRFFINMDQDIYPSEYEKRRKALLDKHRIKVGTIDSEVDLNNITDMLRINFFLLQSIILRKTFSLYEELMERVTNFQSLIDFDLDGLSNRMKLTEDEEYVIEEPVVEVIEEDEDFDDNFEA